MRRDGQVRQERREGAVAFLLSLLALASLLAFPVSAFAFNSAEWMDKRELFAREAERLQAAYTNCVANLQTPADDVTIPVETFDDGSVKVMIFAKKAQYFLDKGLVWAEGVIVRRFKPDGTLSARIEAQNCVVDRFSKSGWAEGPALVVHGKTTFRGKGVYFSSPEAYVKVLESSEVESADLKFGGAAL